MHAQVETLLGYPQYEQRSKEWFEERSNKLTSSDVDTVLGNNDKYSNKLEVLFKKCGLSKPFTGNVATRHGQKYEDEAIEHYCRLYNKTSHAFGLLPHPSISWLGGSPDDITSDGIVIEVKCPLYRDIKIGEIPGQYISQIKMNMEICNLDKSVFIEYRPAHMCKSKEMILNVVHLDRDPAWFPSVYPELESFWNEVLLYRSIGIDKHPMYEKYNQMSKEKVIVDFTSEEIKCVIVESDEEK